MVSTMQAKRDNRFYHHILLVNIKLQYKNGFLAPKFKFTMDNVEDGGFSLYRVVASSLDASKIWYSVPNQLMSNGRKEDFINSDVAKFFSDEIVEINFEELRTPDGGRVHYYMFGSSRKKDSVVVATIFGLLSRSLRRKNLGSDKFLKSKEFLDLKRNLNAFDFHYATVAGKNGAEFLPTLTPPKTPEESPSFVPDVKQPKNSIMKSLANLRVSDIGPRLKAKKARKLTKTLLEDIKAIVHTADDLGTLLGCGFIYGEDDEKDFVKNAISSALSLVAETTGYRKAFMTMLSDSVYHGFIDTMKVPDWVQLFVKLATKMSDKYWQTMLNFLNLGRSGKAIDAGILLSNNEIRAKKALVFDITRDIFNISLLPSELRGYCVSLPMVLIWAIRESRLHQSAPVNMEFNLKLDGRPLAGRNQVSVGVVPITLASATKSCQSSLSVYPLAIANCEEKRENIKMLLTRLNEEKKIIKENGLLVDGKIYKIKFKVTLDLKALLMLMVDPDNEEFVLGDRGLEVEFCVYCDAIRACKEHWNGAYDEVCLTCLQSKANIGNWTGFRDDLTFLLDEELSSIPLCSLHCEMRNTEQLFGSLGLFAYKCGCLEECNMAMANYGPESSWGYDKIQIKLREGQQTAITKSNVKVSSFSGSTAKALLKHSNEIICQSLPMDSVVTYYQQVSGAAKDVVLGFVSFTHSVKDYLEEITKKGTFVRDYGARQEEVLLTDNKVLSAYLENEIEVWKQKLEDVEGSFLVNDKAIPSSPPKKKKKTLAKRRTTDDKGMAVLAAKLQIDSFKEVFEGWKEIDLVMREEIYEDDDDEKIDIFDLKCKIWGLRLRHLFGVSLGAGDYIHYTVDHSAMLLRLHRSFVQYSNQGFEGSHKIHRALYSRATSHDQAGDNHSINQILTHVLSEKMLSLRLQFVKAKECITEGKANFFYRGCGWQNKSAQWSTDDQQWIYVMGDLFQKIFGKPYLTYHYDKNHGTNVDDSSDPRKDFSYDHAKWESKYKDAINNTNVSAKKSRAKNSLLFAVKKDQLATDKATGHTDPNDRDAGHADPNHRDDGHADLNDRDDGHADPNDRDAGHADLNDRDAGHTGDSYQDTTAPVIDLTGLDNKESLNSHTRAACLSSSVTRRQFGDIDIPAAIQCPKKDVKEIFGDFRDHTDPFTLTQRPSESIVQWAEEALRKTRRGKRATAVKLGNLGIFTSTGVEILNKYCEVAKIKGQISQEELWLSNEDGFPSYKTDQIKNVLWERKMTETILSAGTRSIDLASFTTLVGERYLDNFVINCVILRYVQDQATMQGNGQVIYLPSEAFTWLESGDDAFISHHITEAITESKVNCSATLLMVPVHMEGCHWGLVAVDFLKARLLFDDGMKLPPRKTLLSDAQKLLDLAERVQPDNVHLSSKFWKHKFNFERFGMPYQITGTTQGSGSCGVGVILATRDLMKNPESKFDWNFNSISTLRKHLCLKIIEWSNERQ